MWTCLPLLLILTPGGQREDLTDQYRRWLETDVRYIVTAEEEQVFRGLSTDEERERFIEQFWLRRDPDPSTPSNETREEHYRRIAYANERFSAGLPGWKTDRGRIYIKFGPPDHIESWPAGSQYVRPNSEGGGTTVVHAFEVWHYRHLEGVGDDIQIEFVDRDNSDLYVLASDEMDKDAFLYVQGEGLTLAEEMGLSTKADRLRFRNHGDLDQKYQGQFASFNPVNQPFEKMFRRALLNNPPPIHFDDLRSRVTSRVYYDQVPMQAVVDRLEIAPGVYSVPVAVRLPLSSYRLYGRVETLTRQLVFEFDDEVQPASSARPGDDPGSLLYQRAIPLERSGRFKLTLIAEDRIQARLGTLETAFVVEPPGPTLRLSSVMLADSIERSGTAATVTYSGFAVRPNISRVFRAAGYLGTYFEIYGLSRDALTSQTSAKVSFLLSDAADGAAVSSEQVTESETTLVDLGSRMIVTKLFSLRRLKPGRYRLQITAEDTISSDRVQRTLDFRVTEPASLLQAGDAQTRETGQHP